MTGNARRVGCQEPPLHGTVRSATPLASFAWAEVSDALNAAIRSGMSHQYKVHHVARGIEQARWRGLDSVVADNKLMKKEMV